MATEETGEPLELPPDVSALLVKGVGAYLRQSAQLDLPTRLRRFRGFTDKSLMRHAPELLGVLEDEAQRALIDQWLTDGKAAVSKNVSAALTVAARREEGWAEELRKMSNVADGVSGTSEATGDKGLEKAVEREKAKAIKARDELRLLRDESAATQKKAAAEITSLTGQVTELKTQLKDAVSRATAAEKQAGKSEERAEREVRLARKDADEAEQQMLKLKDDAKGLRKELEEVRAELARLSAPDKPKPAPRKKGAKAPSGPRKPLSIPKGRYEDAPETLDEWLGAPRVHLVIDGYNVTKAEGGYGDLPLEKQRERLIDEAGKLAARRKVTTTIVFDGSEEVGPRPTRAGRSPVKVEYSKAEIADDHIVALIERLPAYPLILATNDRELQERARTHGATIATSNQLLALFR